MTTATHVLTGAVLTQACGPALGLPLAVASHVALDFACRYHPPDLGWPWGWGELESKAVWVRLLGFGRPEAKLLWLVNAAAIVAVLVMGGYHRIDWFALLVGGVIAGWLGPDAFHLLPYWYNYPHRLADWLRARYWPRPVDLPWGAWAEAGLIVGLAIVTGITGGA